MRLGGNVFYNGTDAEEYAFEKGTKTMVYFSLDEKFVRTEYEIIVSEEDYFECVVSDLSYETVTAKHKEIVSVTNNGSEPAEFVQVYVLFFKGEKVVEIDHAYYTDDDFELKPGKTMTKELECYEDYDSVQIFLMGRRE